MRFEEDMDYTDLMEEVFSDMDLEEQFEMLISGECPKCLGDGCSYCLCVEKISTR